ncbi:MAG: hypothetical protein M3O26_06175, partial [Pseudomonadota bacterium]|nr:hypothetical protein [Pseudomonadota bacterium]
MRTAKVLALCAVAAIAACHKESATEAPPVQAAAPVAARKGPGAEQLTAGMVEAPSQGKSQLPVKLKFALEQRPAVGHVFDLTVALIPQIDAGSASIEVAGDALSVAPQMNRFDLPAVEAGQVYRQSIQVTPTAAGVLLL